MFHDKNEYLSTYFCLASVSIIFMLIRAIRGEYSRLNCYRTIQVFDSLSGNDCTVAGIRAE